MSNQKGKNESLSREGHRQRMRETYLSGGMEKSPDHNLLELFLSLVIAQKDVKQLSYDLINEFGSLEGVIKASPEDLMAVKGIGEVSAVAISMVNTINKRIVQNRNNDIVVLDNTPATVEYCKNILSCEKIEKMLEITLNGDGSIINRHIVTEGCVNLSPVDYRKIIANAVKDNAAAVIIAHNHPNNTIEPSVSDINFTSTLKGLLAKMNIYLLDHIIVSGDKGDSVINILNSKL